MNLTLAGFLYLLAAILFSRRALTFLLFTLLYRLLLRTLAFQLLTALDLLLRFGVIYRLCLHHLGRHGGGLGLPAESDHHQRNQRKVHQHGIGNGLTAARQSARVSGQHIAISAIFVQACFRYLLPAGRLPGDCVTRPTLGAPAACNNTMVWTTSLYAACRSPRISTGV